MESTITEYRFTFTPTTCMLCGGSDARPRYTITKFKQGDLRYVTCKHCGTAYQSPMPDQESMQAFYHSQEFFNAKANSELLTGYRDYDAEEVTRQANARTRLAGIESLCPSGQKLRILKVACGYGALVKLARDRGHEADGIDFSSVMVQGAKERYNIDLIEDDFLTHDFGERKFDVVVLYGAINNFLRPLDVASKALSILEAGGFYIVNHVWLNSFPERLMGHRYWIYRPPIIGLYPRRAFEEHHLSIGYELHRSKYDIQYLTLDKFFGYLQFRPLLRLVERLRMAQMGFTIPIPGYARVFFKKPS